MFRQRLRKNDESLFPEKGGMNLTYYYQRKGRCLTSNLLFTERVWKAKGNEKKKQKKGIGENESQVNYAKMGIEARLENTED